jgi:O-antigen/teichoic acid export membrane protein
MERAKEARTFAADTLIVAFTQGIGKLRALITLPLVVKLLGTEGYGLWSQTFTFASVAGTVFMLNLHLPLVRFVAGDPSGAGRVYATTLAMSGGVFVLLVGPLLAFLAPLSALVMGRPGLERYLLIGLLLIVVGNVRLINNNLYRATGRFAARSLVDLVSTVGGLAIVFILLLRGSSLTTVLLALACWDALIAIATTIHCLRIVGWAAPRSSIAWEALRYCMPLMPSGLAIALLDRADRFFLGNSLGLAAVGVYSANYALASSMLLFQAPLQITLLPKVSSLWEKDRVLAGKYLSTAIHAFLTAAIPCALALPVVASPLLQVIGNAQTASGGRLTVLLLGLGVLLWGVALCQSLIFYAAKQTTAIARIMVATAVLNVALCAVLVPRTGLFGAALATFICYAAACAWLGLSGRQHLRLTWHGKFLAKCTAAATLTAAVLFWWGPSTARSLVAALACAGVLYPSLLVALRAIPREHLKRVKALLGSVGPT